jgi:hypothetical protein
VGNLTLTIDDAPNAIAAAPEPASLIAWSGLAAVALLIVRPRIANETMFLA